MFTGVKNYSLVSTRRYRCLLNWWGLSLFSTLGAVPGWNISCVGFCWSCEPHTVQVPESTISGSKTDGGVRQDEPFGGVKRENFAGASETFFLKPPQLLKAAKLWTQFTPQKPKLSFFPQSLAFFSRRFSRTPRRRRPISAHFVCYVAMVLAETPPTSFTIKAIIKFKLKTRGAKRGKARRKERKTEKHSDQNRSYNIISFLSFI